MDLDIVSFSNTHKASSNWPIHSPGALTETWDYALDCSDTINNITGCFQSAMKIALLCQLNNTCCSSGKQLTLAQIEKVEIGWLWSKDSTFVLLIIYYFFRHWEFTSCLQFKYSYMTSNIESSFSIYDNMSIMQHGVGLSMLELVLYHPYSSFSKFKQHRSGCVKVYEWGLFK